LAVTPSIVRNRQPADGSSITAQYRTVFCGTAVARYSAVQMITRVAGIIRAKYYQ